MNKIFLIILPSIFLVGFLALSPDIAQAATPLVDCDGTRDSPCEFCQFVQMANGIINWFFGLVFILFGVIAFIAGFNLMTSGGNQTKLDDAKKKLTNAVVGLIIVFAAWLIVDTLMKLLVTDGNVGGALGTDSVGMWHTINCDTGLGVN